MIKMIKQTDEDTFYWEIWEEEENQELLEHFGIVGDQGESRRFALPTGEDAEVWMEEIAEEKESEGYEYLDEEELHELVVQYSYEEDQIEEALERRHAVEELMNECLGWTGNGHCDGGDIGSGTRHQGELALIPPPPVQLFVKPGFKLHPSLREQEDQDYEK